MYLAFTNRQVLANLLLWNGNTCVGGVCKLSKRRLEE